MIAKTVLPVGTFYYVWATNTSGIYSSFLIALCEPSLGCRTIGSLSSGILPAHAMPALGPIRESLQLGLRLTVSRANRTVSQKQQAVSSDCVA